MGNFSLFMVYIHSRKLSRVYLHPNMPVLRGFADLEMGQFLQVSRSPTIFVSMPFQANFPFYLPISTFSSFLRSSSILYAFYPFLFVPLFPPSGLPPSFYFFPRFLFQTFTFSAPFLSRLYSVQRLLRKGGKIYFSRIFPYWGSCNQSVRN